MTDRRFGSSAFFRDVAFDWETAKVRVLAAGSTVVDRGDPGVDVFVPLSGRFRASILTAQGRELLLRDLGPGDLFGEIACFEGKPRSARIVALTRGEVVAIPGPRFREAVLASPLLAQRLIVLLAGRQRELSERLEEFGSLSVRGRLCRDLLRWSIPRDASSAQLAIRPPPTNGEIAARIGCRPEQVSRALNALMRAGAVARTKGALVIIDTGHLQALGDDVARSVG